MESGVFILLYGILYDNGCKENGIGFLGYLYLCSSGNNLHTSVVDDAGFV